ncbi:MAG: sigma-54-dependent Fis family transcriptional regulator [Candidatus Marinimicrobia bacterium]|nr:sigma-54-dependent Fis family transcriptional regulator [Candidatus Neomarinimicrobiota bacterium]
MRILIVDDVKNIRVSLSQILKDESHEVWDYEDGETALEFLKKQSVDLIFLDVKLPGISGLDVLDEVREDYPETDVIVISGHGGIQTAVTAVKNGAFDFMEKPLSLPKISIAVRNIEAKRKMENQVRSVTEEWSLKNHLVGDSPQINHVREMINRIGPTDSRVLITGESGTGKELVAHALHKISPRYDEAFIKFNSAAIPKELVESELFGHEKGAFTGADRQKKGKMELADQGTLFLDEIGDMNLDAQAKILRVLEDGILERVGGNTPMKINVRIIAATNRDLQKMVTEGSFREDLYYRINVIPVHLPPLRERAGDILTLFQYFLRYFAKELKFSEKSLTLDARQLVEAYDFPGNIRELKNLVERLYILVPKDKITKIDILPHLNNSSKNNDTFIFETKEFNEARRDFERNYLKAQLQKFNWNISETARNLGLHQPNLSRKINELGIDKE